MQKRRRKTQIALRNSIVRNLNNWALGCLAQTGDSLALNRHRDYRTRFFKFEMLVFGVDKNGLAILIYPMMIVQQVPHRIASLMLEYQSRGALVGCAKDIGDAWDIVSNDKTQYKRKSRTYDFLWVLEKRHKNKKEFSDESE